MAQPVAAVPEALQQAAIEGVVRGVAPASLHRADQRAVLGVEVAHRARRHADALERNRGALEEIAHQLRLYHDAGAVARERRGAALEHLHLAAGVAQQRGGGEPADRAAHHRYARHAHRMYGRSSELSQGPPVSSVTLPPKISAARSRGSSCMNAPGPRFFSLETERTARLAALCAVSP